jgi:hypothetical protein
MGIHRLVRVSPFDSSGRRHTSFASVEVMPEIDDDVDVEIRDEDIKMVRLTLHRTLRSFAFQGEGRRVTVKLYFREMLPYLLHKLLRSILLFHLRSSAKV